MLLRTLICLALGFALGGCCHVPTREALAKNNPGLVVDAGELWELDLDFWEKMDRLGHDNNLKFFELVRELGCVETEEARQRYSDLLKTLQRGQEKWSQIFPDIRSKMDPVRDLAFYYSTKHAAGVLIVRNGKIRHKIIVSGEGHWRPNQSSSVNQ